MFRRKRSEGLSPDEMALLRARLNLFLGRAESASQTNSAIELRVVRQVLYGLHELLHEFGSSSETQRASVLAAIDSIVGTTEREGADLRTLEDFGAQVAIFNAVAQSHGRSDLVVTLV